VQTADPTTGMPVEHGRDSVVLGRYRLVRRLGAGGFGVVWLAHDERLDRAVAVKRIPVGDPRVAVRAEREAIAAARLAHPGIVALYEAGRDDDAVYLVSELVRGRALDELIAAGELSDREVLRIGVALCEALEHAHRRGVVHRDVKPGNVIVPDGAQDEPATPAKLTDFGVARVLGDDALTLTGDVVGTLAYMAPEQAEGREVTGQADLYALALVLYEGLSGVNPVRAPGAAATARRVGARLAPLGRLRRDLPLELCRAVDRAVAPRPEERGATSDLRAALEAAMPVAGEERGTIAGPLPATVFVARDEEPERPGARARILSGLAAGLLVTAAAAWLGPAPPVPAPAVGLVAGIVVVLAPRGGWLLAALALTGWLAGAGAPGSALLLAVGAAPTPLLLPRSARLWSAPAGAPLLGLAALAGAWPALAGQAGRLLERAALGALGFWWLAIGELLTGDRLAFGAPVGAGQRGTWEGSATAAASHALWPLLASGTLAVALLWALGAALLPALVRGRAFAFDLAGAAAWAAGLASAGQALARAVGVTEMRGAVLGAVAAGALAIAAQASRGRA
jgi:hypothetical protein